MLDKLLTTKYPLGVILMEVACQASRKRASLWARWIPRLENEEADALTNSDVHHFQAENRIEVELEKLQFLVMDELFATGEEYVQELAALKEGKKQMTETAGVTPAKKRRKGEPLSVRDPW